MGEYTSGNITFQGLGNGTDFSEIISGLVKLESVHKKTLESWKSTWEEKRESLQELNTALLSLQTTLKSMDTESEFLVKTATSTATSYLTASADADALNGTHTIVIDQLATNDVLTNTGYGQSSLADTITSSDTTFVINYKGTDYSISVPANTTLQGLVNRINSNAELKNKVKATTVNDGSSYHLQLNGMDLGAEAQVEITSSGLPDYQASDFTETSSASNAKLRVDGFPPAADEWIERDSNSIDDVVEGLTLNLLDATGGAQLRVTVGTDTDAIRENVEKFVDGINSVRSLLQEMTKFDEDTQKGSILTGNYGVDMLIGQRLENAVAEPGQGFQYLDSDTGLGDPVTSLAQLGIMTDATEGSETEGLLVIDYTELNKYLDADPDEVAKLFSANYLGESESGNMTYLSCIEGRTQPGIYDVEYKVKADGTGLEWATIGGKPAKISENWEITGKSEPVVGIAIRADTRTPGGTFDGTVTLKNGKVNQIDEMLEQMTSDETGPIEILRKNYKEIIENIDDKIAYETTRINLYETRLKERYARLEATLSEYNNISSALTSAIDQLAK